MYNFERLTIQRELCWLTNDSDGEKYKRQMQIHSHTLKVCI